MRVYATTLWLKADRGIAPILATTAQWLTGAEQRNARDGGAPPAKITADDLSVPGRRQLTAHSDLEIVHTPFGQSPLLVAIRYMARDKEIRQRTWITEIGIRAEQGATDIECSVYLHIDDVSTRVAPPKVATRPLLVRDLLRRCEPTERTNGLRPLELTRETAPSLAALARSSARTGPLILLSATSSGEYLADARNLEFQLGGLGTVVTIPASEDTRLIADVVGDGLTPYAGAVTILYPPRSGPYSAPIPRRRILPDELVAWHLVDRC